MVDLKGNHLEQRSKDTHTHTHTRPQVKLGVGESSVLVGDMGVLNIWETQAGNAERVFWSATCSAVDVPLRNKQGWERLDNLAPGVEDFSSICWERHFGGEQFGRRLQETHSLGSGLGTRSPLSESSLCHHRVNPPLPHSEDPISGLHTAQRLLHTFS